MAAGEIVEENSMSGDPGETDHAGSSRSLAPLVAAGIFLSRIAGLVRESVFGYYFGSSSSADAFRVALRGPNVLQNLLGEGVLSASFIPVYSELLEQGREEEAGKVAGAIFALLFALAGGLALIGILAAPLLVTVFAVGFRGDPRFDLTVSLVRIIFPMTGVLVLSAWSLGVLNSHRKFFVSYVAPVLWNAAMIAAMVIFGARLLQPSLAIALAWGALAGGALQFLVQLPWVLKLERSLRIRWDLKLEGVRTAVRNAGPAIAGRGVVQLSSWVDLVLASVLAVGAVASLGYAQILYLLPISLFGMSVAAAELPELSRKRMGEVEVLRKRVNRGLRQIAFFVVPSVFGYFALGDVLIGAYLERGEFDRSDTLLVYAVLVGYTIGLLASTGTRLFSSAYFALHDTKTPAIYAAVRVTLSGLLGVLLMVQLGSAEIAGRTFGPYGFGILDEPTWAGRSLGPAGLSLAAGLAAWVEWWMLRRTLSKRIGPVNPPGGPLARMFVAAALAAVVGRGGLVILPDPGPLALGPIELGLIVEAIVGVTLFAATYFAVSYALRLEEVGSGMERIRALLGR